MPIQLPSVGLALAALLVAALVALISTPVVRSLAFRVGAVDVPRDDRRMHDHPIPRMGGLAIFFGFILSVLIFLPLTPELRGMLLRDRNHPCIVLWSIGNEVPEQLTEDGDQLAARLKEIVRELDPTRKITQANAQISAERDPAGAYGPPPTMSRPCASAMCCATP